MYPQRKRFDARAKVVVEILVQAGLSHQAPMDAIWSAIRRGLGLTRSERIREIVETMHACGFITTTDNPTVWAIHPDVLGIRIPEEEE
uniref:Uncharacterized protein n=1 Tax=viral metagenome TaxID=1070528 RepID=A0A6H2A6J3_9ZZZZ